MRIFSALAVCGICTGTGFALRARLLRRVRVLEQLCRLPAELRSRGIDGREPIPALIASLARQETFSELDFLGACADAADKGGDLPDAWEQAVRQFLRSCPELSPIGDTLLRLGGALAGGNSALLLSLLTQCTESCTRRLTAARQRAASAGKLCVQLGVGAGVLLGILIL